MRPMTVRWKPLLVLSGLFVVIALVGFVAIAATLMPRKSSVILPSARAERKAGRFAEAKVHYQRALQIDGKNPAIHEELASMFAEWAGKAPEDKRAEILNWRLFSLAEAAKYGKTLKEPRRQLLLAAMIADETPEGLHWAKDLLTLEPADADAHYVVATAMLEERTPAIPEVQRHLAALEAAKASEVRVAWIKARTAHLAGDAAGRAVALTKARTLTLPPDAGAVDRTALVQLRALDAETTVEPARLAERVGALQAEARILAAGTQVAPNRIVRLSLLLERVQKTLMLLATTSDAATRQAINAQVDAVEADVASIFKRSLATARKIDLYIYLTYAQHLRFRNQADRCQEVVAEALKSPLAEVVTNNEVVLKLHAVAVEAALSDTADKARFDKAVPHINVLIASPSPRYQGLGYLFQGAIELERSGIAGTPSKDARPADASSVQPKLRASALNHLKLAAAQLPDVAEAQARYGVALVLAQEQALGRQYLQNAIRLGQTDPQYQVWAAWTMVQAGYPEEAEPIVNHLKAEVSAGHVSHDLEPTLHLLGGEICQARRTPDDLKKALVEYDHSYVGKVPTPIVQLRMAQIDVQLGQPEHSLQRIGQLRATGQGGSSAEHLAVLILLEMKKKTEAMEALFKARRTYPDSDELIGLEAAVLIKDEKPKDADAALSAFLEKHPDNMGVTLMRSQVLSDLLGDVKEARRLLANVADRGDNSAPLVQLALLDLKQKDYDAVSATIAKLRARWKEAAAADLLDAQLALDQGKLDSASSHFEKALEKDPGNKVVQYWKAQLDNRRGDRKGAARALEEITAQGSSKELEEGIPLTVAAQSALANMALQNGELDIAIRRFESLRSGGGSSSLDRGDRWQLAAAYTARNQWPAARREIAALLNDSKNPPSYDERVRAANFYRQNKDEAAALAQLDYVLSVEAAHPAAVVTKAYILAEAKKSAEAADLLRKALATPSKEKPPAVFFLVLAAMESAIPPEADAPRRALVVLDQGLAAQPKMLDLVQAKYHLLLSYQGAKAAVAFVESAAKDDAGGPVTRLLADVYREQDDLDSAERTLRDLVAKNANDVRLTAALVRVTALQAGAAGDRGDRDHERSLNDKAATFIRAFRTRFPTEVVFPQEDFELALRKGDQTRALAVTKEIDQLAGNSPVGPLLRARLYAAQGKPQDMAAAYTEALDRNPAQPEVRVLLGQTDLQLGRTDEALRQARAVLDTDEGRGDALLLEARALAETAGTPAQQAASRARAVELLSGAIQKLPKFSAAYHTIAEIQLAQNQPDAAIATLRKGVEAVPDDGRGVAQLVELLARPALPGGKAAANSLAALQTFTAQIAQRDTRGNLLLGVAIGLHKADQLELALQWIQKAEAKLDAPVVHLNHGDILLTIAERSTDTAAARPNFERAVAQYDLVLKNQATSVEAVNNKAWILHTYLGQSQKALELTTAFMSRVDPSTLPGEFYDTLGAIQEASGKTREAEESFARGLLKTPDHPVLNFHMGRLLAADRARANKAGDYLRKALDNKSKLSPNMAAEVATLVEKTRR
jgi:cellulose synthase operon protein C